MHQHQAPAPQQQYQHQFPGVSTSAPTAPTGFYQQQQPPTASFFETPVTDPFLDQFFPQDYQTSPSTTKGKALLEPWTLLEARNLYTFYKNISNPTYTVGRIVEALAAYIHVLQSNPSGPSAQQVILNAKFQALYPMLRRAGHKAPHLVKEMAMLTNALPHKIPGLDGLFSYVTKQQTQKPRTPQGAKHDPSQYSQAPPKPAPARKKPPYACTSCGEWHWFTTEKCGANATKTPNYNKTA